jgi:glycine cleavage system H protein
MIPSDRKYIDSHEWIKIDGDLAVVGITDFAQDALGDITFVELPAVDAEVTKGGECCVIESVKAASDMYSPLSGVIAEVNTSLETEPEKINASPYEEGWVFKLKNFDSSEVDALMDAAAYEKFLETCE